MFSNTLRIDNKMKRTNEWTGTRSAPINEWTNAELNDNIKSLTERRYELIERNDPILDSIVRLFDELLAQLIAERAERIGK